VNPCIIKPREGKDYNKKVSKYNHNKISAFQQISKSAEAIISKNIIVHIIILIIAHTTNGYFK